MRNVPESSLTDSSDERSDYRLAKDYSKYVIIAEKEFKTPGDSEKSTEVAFHNAHWNVEHAAKVCCNQIFSKNNNFHAEILFIDGKEKTLKIRKKFNPGTTTARYFEALHCTSVVIRILEEKKQFQDQLAEQWTPDVTFVVNGEKCEANRQYLANASPVFRKMLFGKFAEAKQSEIVLEDIESADVFKDFILAVSHFGVQPNPTNVLAFLKLAHQYDVPNLMRENLKFCYEIPIEDRIFLAAEYDLNDLKAHTALGLTNECLKKMWKDHKEKLLKPEFVYLFDIVMDRLK